MSDRRFIDSVRRRSEITVNELRSYEDPPPVKVYDLNGNFLRFEPPTVYINPTFNNRKRGAKC